MISIERTKEMLHAAEANAYNEFAVLDKDVPVTIWCQRIS